MNPASGENTRHVAGVLATVSLDAGGMVVVRWTESATDGGAGDGFFLPVGTATLLMADIEGSVRAWEVDAHAMTLAVAQLDELVANTLDARGGVRPVEHGEGDSFVAAFARASDAVAAALELQVAMTTISWPGSLSVSMRMALHSGEVQLRDEGNDIGSAINRCARLRALAHGGQVVLSAATTDLVLDALPQGAELRDLGVHRLRDLARPEHVFQLCHPELRSDFPALRSLDSVSNNLPIQLTTFVGRQREMAELHELIASNRLVTLSGSGGCGKTRLALQVAADELDKCSDGVWFVDLAPVTGSDQVARTMATVLGARETQLDSTSHAIARLIADRNTMVVLDNCEHVVGACADLIDELLHQCPMLSILATSREPLGVEGEVQWRVPSLSTPDAAMASQIDRLRQCDAVRLLHRPGAAVPTELRGNERERTGSGGDLQPARRHPSGHRAGGGACTSPHRRADR